MNETERIGKVTAIASAPSTDTSFFFWTKEDVKLSLFDVIKVVRKDKTKTYGVIESMQHYSDAPSHEANYISNDFGKTDDGEYDRSKRIQFNLIRARVLMSPGSTDTPVENDAIVYYCNEAEIIEALGLSDNKPRIPLGYISMYGGKVNIGISLREDRILGPACAHLNISGISGLAAKTTSAMTFLNSIYQIHQNKEEDATSCPAIIIFNVKGQDLMHLHESNDYNGIEPSQVIFNGVFEKDNVKIKPFDQGSITYYTPGVGDMVFPFSIVKEKYFKYLFAGDPDESKTLESLVTLVEQDKDSKFRYFTPGQKTNWTDFKKELEQYCRDITENDKNKDNPFKSIRQATWAKARRIISTVSAPKYGLFKDPINKKTPNDFPQKLIKQLEKNNRIAVIDIERLPLTVQIFVIGVIADTVMSHMEERKKGFKKVIFFTDELNKYAPSEDSKASPIRDYILDIAERGRSQGFILFSAEQFRSEAFGRIVGNCATNLYGRTASNEIANFAYASIPMETRDRMTMLKPGEFILQSPDLPALLKIQFPYPAYKLGDDSNNHNNQAT